MGWKETERAYLVTLKKIQKEAPSTLPELAEGQTLAGGDALLKSGTTTPPPRFTEDTLLAAMEHASAENFAKLALTDCTTVYKEKRRHFMQPSDLLQLRQFGGHILFVGGCGVGVEDT